MYYPSDSMHENNALKLSFKLLFGVFIGILNYFCFLSNIYIKLKSTAFCQCLWSKQKSALFESLIQWEGCDWILDLLWWWSECILDLLGDRSGYILDLLGVDSWSLDKSFWWSLSLTVFMRSELEANFSLCFCFKYIFFKFVYGGVIL